MEFLPLFFNYTEEKRDTGYETIQDFFLSWTLRCACDIYKDHLLIHNYSKKILFSLIFGENSDAEYSVNFSKYSTFSVKEISTKRQFERIDLLVTVIYEIDGKEENVVLNIENKWYTSIKQNQLIVYSEKLKNYTKNKIISVVIFCDKCILLKDKNQITLCKQSNYKFVDIGTLKELAEIDNYFAYIKL